jgi:predicted MFS family arabinose efflux permease
MGCVRLFAQFFIFNPLAKYLKPEKIISYALFAYALSMIIIILLNQFSYIFYALPLTLTAKSFIQTLLISCVSAKGSQNDQGKFHGYHRSVQALGELMGPLLGGILVGTLIWAPLACSGIFMLIAWFVMEKIKKQELQKL